MLIHEWTENGIFLSFSGFYFSASKNEKLRHGTIWVIVLSKTVVQFEPYIKLFISPPTSNMNNNVADIKVCQECGKSLRKDYLKYHLAKEHKIGKIGKLNCEICKEPFRSKARLFEHEKVKHKNENRNIGQSFICEKCPTVLFHTS